MTQASEQIAMQYANANLNKRTWGDVLFNVKAYGAVGDGVTDDTVAIQKAINAAGAAGGGTVWFPAKDFVITSTLNIGDGSNTKFSTINGIHLKGEGMAYVLSGDSFYSEIPMSGTRLLWKGPAGGTMIRMNGPLSGCGVEDMSLDGIRYSATQAGKCLDIISLNNGYFKNVQGISFSNIGLHLRTVICANIDGQNNGLGSVGIKFLNTAWFQPDTPATCVKIEGDGEHGQDPCQCIFDHLGLGFQGGTGGYAMHLAHCDFNNFRNIVGTSYSAGGINILLDGSGTRIFPTPTTNFFEQVAFNGNSQLGYVGSPGQNFFSGYSTAEGVPVPEGAVANYAHGFTLPDYVQFGKYANPAYVSVSTYSLGIASGMNITSQFWNVIAPSASYDFGAAAGGMVLIRDSFSGATCLALIINTYGTGAYIVADPQTGFSTTKGTANKNNIYLESGKFYVENKNTQTRTYQVIGFKCQ